MLDKNPFIIDEFKGLNTGSPDVIYPTNTQEMIPLSDAIVARNVKFTKEGKLRTRDGFTILDLESFSIPDADLGHYSQHWKISNIGGAVQSNRWLILLFSVTGEGEFYDTGSATPSTPVLSITDAKFACVINIFGRLYITPLSSYGTPLAGENVYLYDGTTARKAGGAAPTPGTFTVTNDTQTGSFVTVGKHIFTFAWETDSGFITPVPAPSTWIVLDVTAAANRSVKFANIPAFPAGIAAVHLLMTKVILNYDNVPENWELFKAIRATTNADVEFTLPDTGLVDSADYLLNILDELPACNSISVYAGRLMYNGPDGNPDLIYVTKVADPESVDQTEDYIQIKDGIPIDIYNGRELRGLYYIFKENCTFVVGQDLSIPPNAWKVEVVDSGIGAVPFGIAEVLANPGSLVYDNLIVASLTGIHIFSGTYSQGLLSQKIQGILSNSSKAELKFLKMAIDPIEKILYVIIGDPWDVTRLFVGNYFNGLDPQSIKWATYDFFVHIVPIEGDPYDEIAKIGSILIDPADDLSDYPRLTCLCSNIFLTNILWALTRGAVQDTDSSQPIPWEYGTGFTPNELGYLYSFTHLRLRAGMKRYDSDPALTVLNIALQPMDGATASEGVALPVSEAPGKYYTIPFTGFQAEHVSINIGGSGQVNISKLILFTSEKAKDLPR